MPLRPDVISALDQNRKELQEWYRRGSLEQKQQVFEWLMAFKARVVDDKFADLIADLAICQYLTLELEIDEEQRENDENG